ncbi:MAG: hypothetical protein IT245_03610, partial [Bacteroidia bacterium]|nr:hypothetical protein [Bacteroidia bacterium]
CIGTDSQVKQNIVEFATAIVFIREKHGGCMFFNSFITQNHFSIKLKSFYQKRLLLQFYKLLVYLFLLSM